MDVRRTHDTDLRRERRGGVTAEGVGGMRNEERKGEIERNSMCEVRETAGGTNTSDVKCDQSYQVSILPPQSSDSCPVK